MENDSISTTGKFITIEGQDGAGKTTNLEFICRQISLNGIDHVVSREPGGTPLGESVRDVLLNRNELAINPMSELLLMFAARSQHLESVIEPALAKGVWVICDRFTDASYAYQGGGHGIPSSSIETIESLVQGQRKPDLTILLDVDISVGESRVNSRNESKDRYELQKSEFKSRVRDTYLQRVQQDPQRIKLIDASASMEEVQMQIRNELEAFFTINNT